MKFTRMPIEIESPEQMGYDKIKYNLTESSYRDFKFSDLKLNLNDLVLAYGHHQGHPELRSLIAKDYQITADDVLLTPGAAGALFIAASSLLCEGDEIVVVHPNYGTNIATPLALGAKVQYVNLSFDQAYKLNIQDLKSKISPKTKLISVTTPHNPTGVCLTQFEIDQLIQIAEDNKIWLLIDETYESMVFNNSTIQTISLSERIISVSSVSKSYGIPGIRIGWLLTRSKELQELFLATKEQILICNSVLDEEIAYQFYLKKDKYFIEIKKDMIDKRNILFDWFQSQKILEWVQPEGGVVCFPRFKHKNLDTQKFYHILNNEFSTYVGPGHWFDQSPLHMRIGYGWPTKDELIGGLKNIELAYNKIVL